jgi:ubiquinone/menaquinone biosynthesis C-methylase UbiE
VSGDLPTGTAADLPLSGSAAPTQDRPGAARGQRDLDHFVQVYSSWSHLFPPEKIVLERLVDELPSMRVLDIGVGGGRTTVHLSPRVRQYVGVDMDPGMLAACEKRFAGRPGSVSFQQCNAVSLAPFADASFDFVLFSFNGIDYLRWPERRRALEEMFRVLRPGGYMLFSCHNLNSLHQLYWLKSTSGLGDFLREAMRYILVRLCNGRVRKLQQRDYVQFYDVIYLTTPKRFLASLFRGLGRFCYSKPEAQVRQLEEVGWRILATYAEKGALLETAEERNASQDFWLHYFCRKP